MKHARVASVAEARRVLPRDATRRGMALTHWLFLYAADGLPAAGDVREVKSPLSTTVLAGFPTAEAALASCRDGAAGNALAATQLVELCGAFTHRHVEALRAMRPGLPIGLVSYSGEMTGALHTIFAKAS